MGGGGELYGVPKRVIDMCEKWANGALVFCEDQGELHRAISHALGNDHASRMKLILHGIAARQRSSGFQFNIPAHLQQFVGKPPPVSTLQLVADKFVTNVAPRMEYVRSHGGVCVIVLDSFSRHKEEGQERINRNRELQKRIDKGEWHKACVITDCLYFFLKTECDKKNWPVILAGGEGELQVSYLVRLVLRTEGMLPPGKTVFGWISSDDVDGTASFFAPTDMIDTGFMSIPNRYNQRQLKNENGEYQHRHGSILGTIVDDSNWNQGITFRSKGKDKTVQLHVVPTTGINKMDMSVAHLFGDGEFAHIKGYSAKKALLEIIQIKEAHGGQNLSPITLIRAMLTDLHQQQMHHLSLLKNLFQ